MDLCFLFILRYLFLATHAAPFLQKKKQNKNVAWWDTCTVYDTKDDTACGEMMRKAGNTQGKKFLGSVNIWLAKMIVFPSK